MGGGTRDPRPDMGSLDYFLVLCEVSSFLFTLPRVTFLPHGMIPAIPSFFTPENHPEWPPHTQKSFLRPHKVFCISFSHLPKCGQPMMSINLGQESFGADPIVPHTQISQFFHIPAQPHPTLPPFLLPQLEPTRHFQH